MFLVLKQILTIPIVLFSGGREGLTMAASWLQVIILIEKNCFSLFNFTDLYWIFRMDLTQVTKKRFTFKGFIV